MPRTRPPYPPEFRRPPVPRDGRAPPMGSVSNAYDNAFCESFFATLECELLDRRRFRTQAEAKIAVFDFIEGWYNPDRPHSALGQCPRSTTR